MYAYLRVVAGPDQGRVFNLIEGTTLSIGRGEKTDTRLTDAAVARLHCELRCEGGEFLLTDLESVGGTFIAGQKIEEHALKHGEELQVGNTRLKLFTSAIADTQNLEEAQKSAFQPAIRTDEERPDRHDRSRTTSSGRSWRGAARARSTRPATPVTARTWPSRSSMPISPRTKKASSGSCR